MKKSSVPHLEIQGAPIGDAIFCAKVVSQKCSIASKLLSQLEEVGSLDPPSCACSASVMTVWRLL